MNHTNALLPNWTGQKIVVIGGGGHGSVLMDTLKSIGVSVEGFVDQEPKSSICDIPYLGDEGKLSSRSPNDTLLVNGVGSVKDMGLRRSVFERWNQKDFRFLTMIHPSAVVSSTASLEEGVQVMMRAAIQTRSRISKNSIVNTGAVIDHDCVIGPHSHIAPGATLSGGVLVGVECHIGTGATIVQGRRICAKVCIGAGAVVVRDISDTGVYRGVPATLIPSGSS